MNEWEYWFRWTEYRIGMRGNRKPCVARPQEEFSTCRISRAVSMKMVIEDIKRCHIPAKREKEGEAEDTQVEERS